MAADFAMDMFIFDTITSLKHIQKLFSSQITFTEQVSWLDTLWR